MPRLKNAVPKYRKHKASGQAVVTLSGGDHYLGKHGTKPSRMLYDRLVGEWLAAGRSPTPSPNDEFTVNELILRYLRFAKAFYRRVDGTATDTAANMRPAMRTLRNLYGDIDVDEFGPIALKVVRRSFVDSGNTRGYVNTNVDRIRRMFRWGVAEELVCESTLRRLESVAGLKKGKTAAPDNPPVPPIADSIVDQTILALPPTVAAMVQIQRFTGMRPGEVCLMRPSDIDRSGETWIFIPERHKTEHHGKTRAVVIGPRAQAILIPYLDRDPDAYCFCPVETVDALLKERHAKRVTPISCGTKPGKRSIRGNSPGERYTKDSYRRAIHRACDRVFLPDPPLAQRPRESDRARRLRLSATQLCELKKWQSDQRWSPNQLRHSMATETRQRFGIEAVAASLGHAKTATSEIYALRNIQLAAEVAKAIG